MWKRKRHRADYHGDITHEESNEGKDQDYEYEIKRIVV